MSEPKTDREFLEAAIAITKMSDEDRETDAWREWFAAAKQHLASPESADPFSLTIAECAMLNHAGTSDEESGRAVRQRLRRTLYPDPSPPTDPALAMGYSDGTNFLSPPTPPTEGEAAPEADSITGQLHYAERRSDGWGVWVESNDTLVEGGIADNEIRRRLALADLHAAEAEPPPPTKAIVLEGELARRGGFHSGGVFIAPFVVLGSLRLPGDTFTGPCKVTIEPLEGEGDE